MTPTKFHYASFPGRINCEPVSQLVTLDRELLTERLRALPADTMRAIDEGLRLVLGL